ncbi:MULTISPECIES: lysophospholipid acyltransferase family protein [Mycobacterium]|uniref:Phospholipid/glycerol acyltransferase domain-containing protein n=2 Tax=Mycobacterium avium complex (MAC) TaxID=120793 RepID=A0ABM7KA11_9MYCO|nr:MULTISPECIES: lysophospholipid acyltransferase family protein [Mycobacterium]AFC47546.1 phospholipid/glycerol acyltransferase [Mycobacterium intracellulare MOTT-02]AFC52697.1 phospholipid/glycerol acyltransferase [Mycobacterium paraintracellulare]AFS13303.1 Acyltransferase domain-containing protein [Mycobacterium intracellulare subsp. intracellulare MTCC 9506]ASW94349.1 glycerol acyltransferase [Mycobacterium intracellulare]MCA2232974.1 acyltransferase family protein [Mycobacterium intracel
MSVHDFGGWDPGFTQRFLAATEPLARRWFRFEVRGLESMPPEGGALVVGNHSGGILTPDVLIFGAAFYRKFGYKRPLYTLGHDGMFAGPVAGWLARLGLIRANSKNAARALRAGGVVLVFPGGIYDAYRPTVAENVIDFNGRTGYVRAAIEAQVPIVPVVSIGGQEGQLFLTRGTWLAKRLGLSRWRSDILPVTVGLPFGLSMIMPPNLPLPTKIVSQVLEPIDVVTQFGDTPDAVEVDEHVRAAMQQALDGLARERRFPVLG